MNAPYCSDYSSSNAENLPCQHRAAFRLHDFVDESFNVFLAILVIGGVHDVIRLNEDLVVDAVNVCQGVVMADQIRNAVYLYRGQASAMQKFPD